MNATTYYLGQPTTPDGVIKLITDKYNQWMITQGKSGNGPEEAFTSQDCKIDHSKIKCYNCCKKGHYKSECWAKGGNKEGQHPPRRSDNTDCNNSNCNNNHDSNHNNHNSNNNQGNDNANSANADIEAWAAINEFNDIDTNFSSIVETDDNYTDVETMNSHMDIEEIEEIQAVIKKIDNNYTN